MFYIVVQRSCLEKIPRNLHNLFSQKTGGARAPLPTGLKHLFGKDIFTLNGSLWIAKVFLVKFQILAVPQSLTLRLFEVESNTIQQYEIFNKVTRTMISNKWKATNLKFLFWSMISDENNVILDEYANFYANIPYCVKKVLSNDSYNEQVTYFCS